MAPPSLSLTAQLAAVAADPAAWRFAALSAAFLLLMTFSCAVEEKLFKFLPNFHYYWTTVGGVLLLLRLLRILLFRLVLLPLVLLRLLLRLLPRLLFLDLLQV